MANTHGKDTSFYMGGYDLTGYSNSADVQKTADVAETSVFGLGSKTYIAGMKDGTASFGGVWDGDAGAVDERLDATFGVEGSVLSVLYGTPAVGTRGQIFAGIQTKYGITASLSDAVAWSADVQASGGIDGAKVLHAKGAESSAGSYATVDNGASSANGYAANLHNFAKTGTPAAVIKVTHSPDDAVYADLATFTTVTGITSEQKTDTGTVDRYVKGKLHSIAGAASVTFALLFARR